MLTTAPSVDVNVGVPQLSEAVAVPKAPFIVAVDGLHPSASALPVAVTVGAVASITLKVWLQEAEQPFALNVTATLYVPQVPSVTVI